MYTLLPFRFLYAFTMKYVMYYLSLILKNKQLSGIKLFKDPVTYFFNVMVIYNIAGKKCFIGLWVERCVSWTVLKFTTKSSELPVTIPMCILGFLHNFPRCCRPFTFHNMFFPLLLKFLSPITYSFNWERPHN